MNNWKDFSLIKKIIIGLLIAIVAIAAPEIMILVNLGGMEMTLGFLLLYYKSVFELLKTKQELVYIWLKVAYAAFMNSAVLKPKMFTIQAIFCIVALSLTDSLALSIAFFLPALIGDKVIV
jgi:hypothetical protein